MRHGFPMAASAAGPLGVVLLGVALLLPGTPVRTDQSVAEIAHLLMSRHVAFALSVFLAGLALVVLSVFAGLMYRFLAAAGSEVAGFGAAVSTVSAVLLIVVGMSVASGPTLNPTGQLAVVRAAVDTGNVIIGLAKFAFAGVIVCVIAGAHRGVGRLMCITGAVVGVALLGSALPPLLASSGVAQFGGPLDLAGSGLALLWLFALSVVITVRGRSGVGHLRHSEFAKSDA
jgi:hypothetical protein